MDAGRFDVLVRALRDDTPRRVVLGGLLGSGLATLVSWFRAADSSAKNKNKKKKKKKKKTTAQCASGTKPCGENCILETDCCVCGAGLTCCAGECVNLATSGAHCGACGRACPSGGCIHGACSCSGLAQCPAGCSQCSLREEENGQACAGDLSDLECERDADCPPGSVCGDIGHATLCTIPCGF